MYRVIGHVVRATVRRLRRDDVDLQRSSVHVARVRHGTLDHRRQRDDCDKQAAGCQRAYEAN
jgi:hypothetical protein